MLVYSVTINDKELTVISIGMAALAGLIVFFQWIIAQRTNCPLCITPVLADKDCSKNRHARTLCGSHRLHVSLSILFRNSFRCPYCNEPTALEVRDRLRHPPYSRG